MEIFAIVYFTESSLMSNYPLGFESVQNFMDIPREMGEIDEAHWHKFSPSVFISHDNTSIETMLDGVDSLLQTYPFQLLRNTLQEVSNGYSKKSMDDLRFMRKVLIIGRDTIKLCASKDSSESFLLPLGILTHQLGEVVDSKKPPANSVIQLTEAVDDALSSVDLVPVSSRKVTHRANRALLNEELLQLHNFQDNTICEEDYHKARRLFRSVDHLGIVSYITDPDELKKTFAMEGIELSAQYGATHDMLLQGTMNRQ